MKKVFIPIILISLISIPIFAAKAPVEGEEIQMIDIVTLLIFQLGIVVIAARIGGLFFEWLRIPSVLGELLIGVVIGPYFLGGVALPGFPQGFFPISTATVLPVSPELYAIAAIASIILLFWAGLETDLALMMKFSVVGFAVGFGGAICSFIGGSLAGAFFFGLPFSDPNVLFLGVMVASTSIGISARILSEKRKIDSPEGVTILAGGVTDDVLGLGALTAVVAFITTSSETAGVASILPVILKAILIGGSFAIAVIIFAVPISKVMKKFKSYVYISIFALGLALIIASIFQLAGLAMIIGAYVVGLSLSKTDLSDTVRDSMEVVYKLFVPVFFVVMGMLVDLRAFLSKEVLLFGFIYSAVAIAAKVIGCGIPPLFFNFNRLGALRIGTGMIPRGETTLIIAGIGLSTHLLDSKFFAAAVLATFITIIFAPPAISMLFQIEKTGTKKTFHVRNTVSTSFTFDCLELTGLLELRIIQSFRAEGFYMHSVFIDNHTVYQLRKDKTLITIHAKKTEIDFETDAQDVIYAKTIVYEALLQINDTIAKVKNMIKPELLLKGLTDSTGRICTEICRTLDLRSIIPSLKATTKQEVIEELIDVLYVNGIVRDKESAFEAVMERESSMSTGMQYGVALPHGKTDAVNRITAAIGLSRQGIDFQSIDKQPSTIFVLILSPLNSAGPYIQFMANLSALLNSEDARKKLLECKDSEEIYCFFRKGLGSKMTEPKS
ncbi:MAG: cation:proton antiporter [Chitinispirillales bacterium]|jgi:Kef-type K+ transport system membrane component KefB/mannitol/fructose-specific phosphotransferase system IIA component (Ntr-type)|nr:cation:proton antiporter [Chitinispirillales bacterium]